MALRSKVSHVATKKTHTRKNSAISSLTHGSEDDFTANARIIFAEDEYLRVPFEQALALV